MDKSLHAVLIREVALKVMPPILLFCPTMSGIGDIEVEADHSSY